MMLNILPTGQISPHGWKNYSEILNFSPLGGMKVKLLDLGSIPGEMSAILSFLLVTIIKKYEIEQKVIGFSADNCNTNFG